MNSNNPYQMPQASLEVKQTEYGALPLATVGQRFGTYLIDIFVFYALSVVVGTVVLAK